VPAAAPDETRASRGSAIRSRAQLLLWKTSSPIRRGPDCGPDGPGVRREAAIVIPPGAQASTSNSGCEPSDLAPASATEPQVALIQRGTCDFHVKAENAQAADYDAAIIFNEGQPGRQETLAGTLTADDLSTIPVIGTSFAIGGELYNQVQAGVVSVRVATTTEIQCDVPTANLIAKTKTGRTDRQVVVGAHLDSVPEGPGVNDNGSGSAGGRHRSGSPLSKSSVISKDGRSR
jgi:PA domain/Peptidase family M28